MDAAAQEQESDPVSEPIDTITVTASPRAAAVDRRSYDIDAPDAQALTARDAIERLPGVITEIDGTLSILGQTNIGFLVDGEFFPRELALQIPASQIERVEIVTNPGADGRQDGVLINLVLKSGADGPKSTTLTARADSRERYRLSADYNANDRDWLRIGQLSWQSDRRRFATESAFEYTTPAQRGETALAADDSDFTDERLQGLFVLTRKLPEGRKVGAVAFASAGRRRFDATRTLERRDTADLLVDRREASTFESDGETGSLALSYGRDIAKDNEFGVSATVQASRDASRQTDRVSVDARPVLFDRFIEERSDSIVLTATRENKFTATREVKLGAEYAFRASDEHFSGTDSEAADSAIPEGRFEARREELQAFASYAFPLGAFEVLPGLRAEVLKADFISDGAAAGQSPSYARLLPSLHLSRTLGGFGTLKASVARKNLTPDWAAFDAVRRQTAFDTFVEGTPGLRIGTALNTEASHEVKRGRTTLLTTFYQRERTDRIDRFTDFLGEDLFLTRFVNADETETGLNLNLQQKFGSSFDHVLDASAFRVRQNFGVDDAVFDLAQTSYTVKYNAEISFGKRNNLLVVVQRQGRDLDLNLDRSGRLSSTIRYTRTFDGGAVLTVEGLDLLADDVVTAEFASDDFRRFTRTDREERGIRLTLSKRF